MSEFVPRLLDLDYGDLLPVFDGIGAGVIIVDAEGLIVYYNAAMAAIDELARADALMKRVTEVYDLTPETSLIMQCLKTRIPIVDRALLYRTRMGKIANTLHTVYPLFKGDALRGAICLVREYSVLEQTLAAVSIRRPEFRRSNDTRFSFEDIVGEDPKFRRVIATARMAAGTPSPIMLFGETGTGKELLAQAIHNASGRREGRYIAVNCAAIPETLLEGILFGTTPGAFTGARNKAGLFERASGGTLFLDEVNSMAPGLQAKILRVIQEYKLRRLGSVKEIEIDLKIISSVNKEPHIAIEEKSLRPDLFYRLGVVFIPIPPLRERPGDIQHLTEHFLRKHSRALNKGAMRISEDVLAFFRRHQWPGNIRELEHVIEGALNMVSENESRIELGHLRLHLPTWYRLGSAVGPGEPDLGERGLPAAGGRAPQPIGDHRSADGAPGYRAPAGGLMAAQKEAERLALRRALAEHRGNISQAAASIGISRQLFGYKMKKYGIDRGEHRPQRQTRP